MESFFHSLTQFTLFGGFLWMAILFGIVFISLFVSEAEEEGSIAFFAILCFTVLNYYWGNIPLIKLVTWNNVLGYLGLGLTFTIIRTFFYGRQLALDGYKVTNDNLKGDVFRWWFIWPISLLTWLFSDLLMNFWDFLYERLGHTFEYFMKLGYGSVKEKK